MKVYIVMEKDIGDHGVTVDVIGVASSKEKAFEQIDKKLEFVRENLILTSDTRNDYEEVLIVDTGLDHVRIIISIIEKELDGELGVF